MMKSRKSSTLSLELIVVGVVSLVICVVLIYIFLNRAGIFQSNVNPTCSQQGGVCYKADTQCPDDKPLRQFTSCNKLDGANCDSQSKQCACCMPVRT